MTSTICLARKHYIRKFHECQCDAKKSWNLVNELTGRGESANVHDTIRKHFGDSNNYVSICKLFNTTFINHAQVLKDKIPKCSFSTPSHNYTHSPDCAYLPDITELELKEIINTMKTTMPPGADRIRIRDIYYNFNKLKIVLAKLLNNIFAKGQFPNAEKVYHSTCI